MKKILVVDDDPDITAWIQTVLRGSFGILAAENGKAALEMVRREKPDLILTDVMMPKMSGLDFFKSLHEIKTEVGDIPLIVMSSRASMKDYFEGWAIASFLTKPLQAEELYKAVGTALIQKTDISPKNVFKSSAGVPAAKSRIQAHEKTPLALVAGVDEAVIKDLKNFLGSQNFTVELALDEKDLYDFAVRHRPDIILCQYWENTSVFDAAAVFKKLSQAKETRDIPFFPFCIPALELEGTKIFGRGVMITFDSLYELRKKIKNIL